MIPHDISFLSLLAAAGCGLALVYIASAVRSWHRMKQIPGPLLASFSYLWLSRINATGRQYSVYRDLGNKYGPLVRVGPNELSTDDPELIRRMSAARSTYGKDPWYIYSGINPYVPTMFTTLDPAAHDRMKAQRAGAYGGRETDMERGVDDMVNKLVTLIRSKYLTDSKTRYLRPMEFASLSCYLTLDVITQAGFGRPFGYLEHERDMYDYLSSITKHVRSLSIILDVPWIRQIFFSPLFLRLLGPQPTDRSGMGKLMGMAREIIGGIFENQRDEKGYMIASFREHGLSREECESECLFMIIAGSDTTASVMRILMLCLLSTPRVYARLKAEIEGAQKNGVSEPITVEQARSIPYLHAIVYEGIRMRPPAPGLYPKCVPPEGDMIHGYFVPGGTSVGINTSSLLRSKALFGEDADIFRPERFIEASHAQRIEMERNVELVFGYGRWMCAGKPLAFMELYKVVFELMRNFDFQLMNPTKPWDSEIYLLWMEENMWVRVTEASSE